MGNNYGMDSRQIIAGSGLTKPQNINLLVIFSISLLVGGGGGPKKVDDLLTSHIQ